MSEKISCADLAALTASDALYALFDVRERGEYNAGQIPGATSLARGQIEFRLAALVPDPNTFIVLYDGTDGRAVLAARTFREAGYSDVAVLDGGLPEWRRDGLPVATGVNVPSKAFGERVHHEHDVIDITAEDLKTLRERGADVRVLDVRTPEEYARFCIPGAVNVPGGDLILWAGALRQAPAGTVVINCAGRTRSIIGTAALSRLGVPNVRALRNGTMGWLLAGFELERKPRRTRRAPEWSVAGARELARRIIREEKIGEIAPAELTALREVGSGRGAYLIDVRSEGEFEAGHLPGSLNVPGGQAVQRADDFVAVRNAPVIFISDESARAAMAAWWFLQMGFPGARVLRGGLREWKESGGDLVAGGGREEPVGYEAAKTFARCVAPAELHGRLEGEADLILDVGPSADFDIGHLPGARWMSRGWLEIKLPELFPDRTRSILLASPDERHSILAARTLERMGYSGVSVLSGGVQAWSAAGYPTEKGTEGCLTEPNDVVLSPSIRGDPEEMRRYLEWETNLTRA